MRNLPLGRTGLFVSELCLGTMTFGGVGALWGQIGQLQQGDAERLVGQALDAGINFIDTADVYSEGLFEQITGQALRNLRVRREDVVVATKVFGETGRGANGRGNSRGHIASRWESSAARNGPFRSRRSPRTSSLPVTTTKPRGRLKRPA